VLQIGCLRKLKKQEIKKNGWRNRKLLKKAKAKFQKTHQTSRDREQEPRLQQLEPKAVRLLEVAQSQNQRKKR